MIYVFNDTIVFRDDNKNTHRIDGPAFIVRDYQIWHKHGKRHRLDGPAIIHDDGRHYWYIEGILYTEDEFNLLWNRDNIK